MDWRNFFKNAASVSGPTAELKSASEDGEADSFSQELLVERFRVWLAEAYEDEAAPSGIAAEIWAEIEAEESSTTELAGRPVHDFYAMWSALTSLTQEVRLQGRAFKQVHDSLSPITAMSELLEQNMAAHHEAVTEMRRLATEGRDMRAEQAREQQRALEERVRREMFDLLLSMRDRLLRGLESLSAVERDEARSVGGWKARIFGVPQVTHQRLKAGLAGLEKGYRLSLDHLNDALAGYGLRELVCEGALFDPRTMEAVDCEATTQVAPGTVLEVYQRGYEWDDKLYRTARVKVATTPAAKE